MQYLMRWILIFGILGSFISSTKAQNSIKSWYSILDDSQSKVGVIESWKTQITFEKSKSGLMPTVKKTDICKLIPLKSLEIRRSYFVSSHKKIEKYKLTTAEGKRSIKPVIGDCDEAGIFQSDSKFYTFSKYLKPADQYAEFHVESTIDDVRFFTKEFLSDTEFFAKNRELEIIVPDWLQLELLLFQDDGLDVNITKETLDNGSIKYTYQLENVKALKITEYSPGYSHVSPHLIFLFKKYKSELGKWIPILEDINGLYSWYKEMRGAESYNVDGLRPIVSEIVENCSDRKDSISSIYYWVQDKIRYIAFEQGLDGFRPQKAWQVYLNKYGDCKGMANLLKSMLTVAGFDARLAWLGTRDLPYSYKTPSLVVDNHMISVLLLENQKYFLDATEKFARFGEDAERIQGREILIEDGDSFITDSIPYACCDSTYQSLKFEIKIDEKDLVGKLKYELSGENKRSFYQSISSLKVTDHEKVIKFHLSEGVNTIIDSILPLPIQFNRDEIFSLDMNFRKNNALLRIGDEYYFGLENLYPVYSPDIDTTIQNKLTFHETINQIREVTVMIPEDMEVTYLPKTMLIEFGRLYYTRDYILDGNFLKFQSKLTIPNDIYVSSQLKHLLKVLNSMKINRNQKIILKHKS